MKKIIINDELIGAFMEGNTNAEETVAVVNAARKDPQLKELLVMAGALDRDFNTDFTPKKPAVVLPMRQTADLPMTSLAANAATNDCVLSCEEYILKKRRGDADYEKLKKVAKSHGWLQKGGTPLYNIGRLLEEAKFSVARRFECTIPMLQNELAAGCSVITAVDGNELTGNYEQEKEKDKAFGKTANHAVVVLAVNEDEDYVEIFDPASKNSADRYSISQFEDAWDDSESYMVSVIERGRRPYEPHPYDINDVKLPKDLAELTEAIAENAHEVWAQKRKAEGWTYGPERNDRLKQSPDMIPYCELTDSEKEYDRATAMRSVKLLYRLGYEVVKKGK